MAASNDSSPNFDFLNGDPSGDEPNEWSPTTDSTVGMVDSPQANIDSGNSEDEEPVAEEAAETKVPAEEPVTGESASDASTETDTSSGETSATASHDDDPADEAEPEAPMSFEPPAADETPSDEAPQFDAFSANDAGPDFSAMATNEVPSTDQDSDASDDADVTSVAPALAVTQVSNSAKPKRSTSKKSSSVRKKKSKSASPDSGFTLAGPLAIGLISYAVLATTLLVYLLMYNEPHQLESLPDRAPLSADEFRFVPETASVAPGHELRVGQSARFGNILVEPVRVTRDQAELEHYAKKQGLTAPPAGEDVIKIWLKLTNVSNDQKIAPFDRKLVYDRRFDGDFVAHSDQYVVPLSQRGTDEPNVDMYDISPDGEWDLKGQSFPVLNPGESVTTYLAAGPDEIERLTGPAVWRMLMRKGYNDRTGNGVLTLIDVVFDASEAVSES